MRGQARQDHGRERDAENTERKLDQAIGEVQPRHAAVGEQRGDRRAQHHAQLAHRRADDRRPHQPRDAPHGFVLQIPARPAQQARAAAAPAPACTTCTMPPTNTPTASAITGCSKYGETQAANTIITTLSTTDVNAGSANLLIAVEHAAGERGERHEQQVGEGPAQHLDGQLELAGLLRREARRADADDHRRDDHAERSRRSPGCRRACRRPSRPAREPRRCCAWRGTRPRPARTPAKTRPRRTAGAAGSGSGSRGRRPRASPRE